MACDRHYLRALSALQQGFPIPVDTRISLVSRGYDVNRLERLYGL